MPAPPRAVGGSDTLAAGRGRQRLKIAAIGYVSCRHGIDATPELARAALMRLCQVAIEYVEAVHGALLTGRRIDLYQQGNSEPLAIAAIAYSSARHGIDADVGMAREGLAYLSQTAIDFVETLPREDSAKRATSAHFQLGHGARP
jgi:hypothetical protein